MKERPILFSAPMVRAILAGTKTQTRRIVKPQPEVSEAGNLCGTWLSRPLGGLLLPKVADISMHCPYGQPGDRLWVRERVELTTDACEPGDLNLRYIADGAMRSIGEINGDTPGLVDWINGRWPRPSIHMPRWASRILLDVTGVRVERLQDISEADAIAEGASRFPEIRMGMPSAHPNRWSMESPTNTDECLSSARFAFANLFCKVNGKGRGDALDFSPWDANPWVWCLSFRVLEPNTCHPGRGPQAGTPAADDGIGGNPERSRLEASGGTP